MNRAAMVYNLIMKKKIDWVKIENAYVSGSDGQRAIAARFGVSLRDLSLRSKAGNWVEKRKEYRNQLSTKLLQKSQEKYLNAIDDVMDVLIGDIGILKLINNDPDVLLTSQAPGREVESKVTAATKIADALRKHIGMIDPDKEAKLKLEREKLELEKSKAEAESDQNTEIKVVLGGELDKWAE